jgi:hypothetical protein
MSNNQPTAPNLPVIHVDPNQFDFNSIIKDYSGTTAVKKLVYIGERCPELSLAAFKAAIEELKKGLNTGLYVETISRAREILGNQLGDEGLDQKW